jgi:hypothetical protein
VNGELERARRGGAHSIASPSFSGVLRERIDSEQLSAIGSLLREDFTRVLLRRPAHSAAVVAPTLASALRVSMREPNREPRVILFAIHPTRASTTRP